MIRHFPDLTDDPSDGEPLPDEARIALAYADRRMRAQLGTMFALDRRLARIVAGTSEPILGQMRLAWWREMLGKPAAERPRGDRVVEAIGRDWTGREGALVALVDGWEHMLAETLTSGDVRGFADGRGAPFAKFAAMVDTPDRAPECERAGRRWALADAASHVGPGAERDLLLDCAREDTGPASLPGSLRSLAVLDALARRSIARGGAPLMEGRGASLVAARAAVILR